MTDKEFRRLSRADLVEIIYELQQSEKALQEENAELKRKLEDRRIAISEGDSLAEALAKLDGLFEAAQAAADDYRRETERLLEEARQTRARADEYLSGAEQRSREETAPRQSGGEPDAVPRAVREGRCRDEREG